MNKITQTYNENFISDFNSSAVKLLEAVIESLPEERNPMAHEDTLNQNRAEGYNTALSEVKQTILSAIKEIQ